MKKFVNVRLPVILACSLCLGILTACAFVFLNIDAIWLITAIPAGCIIAIALTLIYKNYKPLIFTALALLFLFAGAVNCFARLNAYEKSEISSYETACLICGTVKEKGEYSGDEYIIVTNATANGQKLNANICAYLSKNCGDVCDNGYKVEFYANLNKQDAFTYGKLNYRIQDNVKYTCSVTENLKSEYRFSLFGTIRSALRSTLFDNLDYDTAAVCYGMLVGDTSFIDENELQAFRFGGIAHIFAVSGLHIAIIFGIVNFICKKLRINKYVSTAASILLIFFYSGVCGFTLSSLRAAIMCTISLIAKLVYAKNDGLNALSVAVIIILMITPLSSFSVGFQLSVCAIGGILIFSKHIERNLNKLKVPDKILKKKEGTKAGKFLSKIKMPKKVSFALGTAFGAQAGTLPVMLANFGYVSGAGLILNVIIIPVLTVMFVTVFAGTLISLIIPPVATFLIPASAVPLQAVISFFVNAGFEKSLISGFGAGLFVPLYFICVLALSDKLNFKFIYRCVAVGLSAVILTTYVLTTTYYPFNGYKIIVSAYNGGGDVIIKSSQGSVLIITDNPNSSYVSEDLNDYYASNLDGVIILGGEDCVTAFNEIDVNCNDVYICLLNINVQPYPGVTVHYEKNFTLCGIDFEFIDSYSLYTNCGGVNVGVCTGKAIPFESCDLLVSKYVNTSCDCDYNVYFNLKDYQYNVYDYGDITFIAKDGKLKRTGILPDITSLK